MAETPAGITPAASGKLCCATLTVQGRTTICGLPLAHDGEHISPNADIRWDDHHGTGVRPPSLPEERPEPLAWRGNATVAAALEELDAARSGGHDSESSKKLARWVAAKHALCDAVAALPASRGGEPSEAMALLDGIYEAAERGDLDDVAGRCDDLRAALRSRGGDGTEDARKAVARLREYANGDAGFNAELDSIGTALEALNWLVRTSAHPHADEIDARSTIIAAALARVGGPDTSTEAKHG